MVKSIPVFAFVFAAFAATSAAAGEPAGECTPAENEPRGGRDARDLFLTTWRMLSRHGAGLRVKVGVGVGGTHAEPRRGREVEEVWLGEIAETARGFSGVTVKAPEGLRHVRPGQTIGFELRHILGWTLDVDDAPSRPEREAQAKLELT